MLINMYSMYDSKTKCFLPTFTALNDTVAIAGVTAAVNSADENNGLALNPEDWNLYFIGSFDDNTGKLDMPDQPKHLIGALQCKLPTETAE